MRGRFQFGLVALLTVCTSEIAIAQSLFEDLPGSLGASASLRSRYEVWNFFEPKSPTADNDYDFVGLRGRFGVDWRYDPSLAVKVEGQANGLIDLPAHASDPHLGMLGTGAVYRANNRRASDGSIFLKQAYVDVRDVPLPGLHLRGGRFEFSEGSEAASGDAGLDWIQKNRIAERLLGPFGWSQIGRSFDGVLLEWNHAPVQLSTAYLQPTQGGFDLAGNETIREIDVVYAAAHIVRPRFARNGTGRVFYVYYGDERGLVPVDNRPMDVRVAGGRGISVSTAGGNWTHILATPIGPIDGLLWGVLQGGRWARQTHAAWAYAAEAGLRPAGLPWKPWLRTGINRGSGDDSPDDSRHETFHQLLPTARLYSFSTLYNLMNNQDVFAQLLLSPLATLQWRTDLHWISLAESRDEWYFGGGATQASGQPGFGFGSRSSADARSVMSVLESQLSYRWNDHVEVVLYYGHHFGGTVVRRQAEGDNSDFGYLEVSLAL